MQQDSQVTMLTVAPAPTDSANAGSILYVTWMESALSVWIVVKHVEVSGSAGADTHIGVSEDRAARSITTIRCQVHKGDGAGLYSLVFSSTLN